MSKKGMSLPIEIIVIIVIALVVLVAMAFFFKGGIDTGQTQMYSQQKWQSACNALKMRSGDTCDPALLSKISIEGVNMSSMCKNVAGVDPETSRDKAGDLKACCEVCCGEGKCVAKP